MTPDQSSEHPASEGVGSTPDAPTPDPGTASLADGKAAAAGAPSSSGEAREGDGPAPAGQAPVAGDASDGGAPALSVMIAGELLNWSDLHPSDGRPAVGGPVPAELLAAVVRPTDSVLVAGPHSLELLEQVAKTAASVDVLARSAPDAEEIAAALGVRVFCGTLDHFGPEHGEASYDVVVALDGVPRLIGPDTLVMPWADGLAVLKSRLAPGGRLLLGAENPFGIERLVQADPTSTVPRDADWPSDVRGDAAAPAGFKAVRAALETADLPVTQSYAVYPNLAEASVGLTAVDEPLAAAAAARAVARKFSGPTLTDPYRTTQEAIAAGLGVELAPAWLFVVSAPEQSAAGAAPAGAAPPGAVPAGAGRVGAEAPAVLPDGAVPAGGGVLLEEQLFTALRVDDIAMLRRTIPAYVDWLRAQSAATAAVAAADNVISDGTSYRLFGAAEAVESTGDALVVAQLGRFVLRSLDAGSRQPWAAGSAPRELTAHLASMAGITVTEELWAAVADSNEMVRPQGSAEQLATIARLSQELADATAQATWFEGQLSALRRSKPYRVGQAVLNPARVVVKRVRRVVR
ncbi:hypothetical protein [Kribbella sp. DT2]|uniref:hypothetical protein n=1 Tax=Kribbella sp. DT2 TaxID=3393427 RepID=UPI003CF23D68